MNPVRAPDRHQAHGSIFEDEEDITLPEPDLLSKCLSRSIPALDIYFCLSP